MRAALIGVQSHSGLQISWLLPSPPSRMMGGHLVILMHSGYSDYPSPSA